VAKAIGGDGGAVVRCWSFADWNRLVVRVSAYWGSKASPDLIGFTIPPHFVNLGPNACRSLDEFTYEHARPHDSAGLDEVALGLNTLAHESNHVRHPGDTEAAVECYAMHSIPRTTQLLGGSARYGQVIARAYFRDLFPEQPSSYRLPGCRIGG
jgi:hypothetical protein